MVLESIPCKCGHNKPSHVLDYPGIDFAFCVGCLNERRNVEVYIHGFKLDNLKYLEYKYSQ